MITKDHELDLLTTALEGGSNYWYSIGEREVRKIDAYDGDSFADQMYNAIQEGEEIVVSDAEDGDSNGIISLDSIQKANDRLRLDFTEQYGYIFTEDWDAETSDLWFQYVVMGEIVFA